MSKTYNSKYDYLKKFPDYEYPNGFISPYGKKIKAGEIIDYDYSYTTHGDHNNAQYTTVRHPNSRKKRGSLGREFTKVGMTGTRYWRNRFGEEHDKSSRCRLVKHQMTHTRRHRLKNEAEKIINEAL